jgi:hypothetical protein
MLESTQQVHTKKNKNRYAKYISTIFRQNILKPGTKWEVSVDGHCFASKLSRLSAQMSRLSLEKTPFMKYLQGRRSGAEELFSQEMPSNLILLLG